MPELQHYHERDATSELPSDRLGIEKVWSSLSEKKTEHLILPDGRSDFILKFHLDEDSKPTSILPIISGPSTSWSISRSTARQGYVGIRFKPGLGGAFFGLSLDDIAGQTFVGDEALLLSPKLRPLCKPAYDIKSLIERLERFFADHHEPYLSAPVASVIDDIHRTGGSTAINLLAKKHGITSRTLARTFLKTVGISPKVFAAIIRFHHSLKLVTNGCPIHEAAHAKGYSDQAHMTRDFRRFGGFTPGNIPEDLTLIELPFF